MMTPLLYAVSCGHMEMVRLLLDLGADKDCCDKNVSVPLCQSGFNSSKHRNVLYYAVISGSESVVKLFLRHERRNEADKLWVRFNFRRPAPS